MKTDHIRLGSCYSNGDFGRRWTVWQVVDMSTDDETKREQVRYKILVGEHRRKYKTALIEEFAAQVRYEVVLIENTWQKVE